ncbi:coiled-coil domain-containing protein 18 isoform X2 [Aplysia californica]|nr:coiled-coil domain-containing protein 18 isoform X2 [Aplysia californica]
MSSSTPSKRQMAGKSKFRSDGFESDSSSESTKENRGGDKYERKLLLQNQRLLLEVERLIGDLHASKVENASLLKEADGVKKIPDLEDKIEELLSESQAQDKALRAAEKHLDEGSKRNSELQKKLDECQAEVSDLRAELEEHKETKKAIESQRDEAVQNLIEMQDSLEDYQRRTKEKIKKLEQSEDHLRDALASVSQERDDLLEQLGDVQTSLASQEAQINRLLHDVELEDAKKQKAEQENESLLRQLDQLTAQLNDFEKESKKSESMRQEKLLLEKELSGHRVVAQDVAELLALFQKKQNKNTQNDSGNDSIQTFAGVSQRDALLYDACLNAAAAELNKNNNGLDSVASALVGVNTNNNGFGCEGSSMIGELRTLFCNMDGEIQRLRCDLKSRDSDDRTYQNLREELKILMDKVEGGMQRNQELECLVVNLEDDKKNLEAKLDDALRALEDRDRQIQCLDTRLNERNRQVICLQEDISDKAQRISSLEKEIREFKKRIDDLTTADVSNELEMAMERIKELEEVLSCKESAICELQMKVSNLQKDMKAAQTKYEKKISCLCDQVQEYQRQVEVMSEENETVRQKHSCCSKAQDDMRRTIRSKEDCIKQLESEIEELKITLEEKEKLSVKLLESCQDKLFKSNEQVQQLESALMMCKNEVCKHLQTMEEIKNHFEYECTQKDNCIKQLNESLRRTKEDLECKVDEVSGLEHTVMTLKCKIEQLFNSLKESENNNACLTEKLKQCENQNLQEKACCMKESEELERKLSQALNNLNCTSGEINKLKNQCQEKSNQIDNLTTEKNSVTRDLHSCKQKACELQDQLNKMEADNTELCQQLHHKMECIKDLETALCNKDHELKACTRCLEELNNKLATCSSNQADTKAEINCLMDKLKACCDELLKKNRLLCECEEALKHCQTEVQAKCEEIQGLNCQLEEVNCKLQERIVKVEELEKAIEALHKETDKRMKRVDEQLRRYECELTDKVRQLTDLDECLNRCQHNLNEKTNECCQLEQRNNRLCGDMQTLSCKLRDMEEQRDCCGKQLSESKAENAEITQELRVTREELQTQHQELVETRQALTCCNREVEKARREIDELNNIFEKKECEMKQLCEDKNCLLNKIAHLQCRMESEAAQAAQQMADLKCLMEKEMESMRLCVTEVEEKNSCLMQKLTTTQRQLQQVEKCCHQKLDSLNRELEDLLNRLADREDQIAACKDCINMKESEIMRLKLRLCNCDRNCSNSNQMDRNSEDVDGGRLSPPVQDDIGMPNQGKMVAITAQGRNSQLDSDLDSEDFVEQSNRLTLRLMQPKSGADTGGHGASRSEDDWLPQQPMRVQGEDQLEDQSSEDHNSSSARNSLGVSEVQERLRSNQRLQMEIEKQLKSLGENITDDLHQTDQY